jgi:hypothetical protein
MKIVLTYIMDYGKAEDKSEFDHLIQFLPSAKEIKEKCEITIQHVERHIRVEE